MRSPAAQHSSTGRLSFVDLVHHLQGVLVDAQSHRSERGEWVEGPSGRSEVDWVRFERTVLLDEVNRLRSAAGRELVTVEQILRKESLALGHHDYPTKFAIGAADLVRD